MLPLPLSPFLPFGPAIVPYKARGVFTPCPTPLPSSGAFLGQADVLSVAFLDRLLSFWRRLAGPGQSYNPFVARPVDLLRSLCGLGSSPWQDRRAAGKRKVTYKR